MPRRVWRRPLAATAWMLAALAALAAVAGALVGSTAAAQRPAVGSTASAQRPAVGSTAAAQHPAGARLPGQATPAVRPPQSGRRPNIVFVLTDDLSSDLVRFMPHVRALAAHGTSFSNYFVSDSLCCPSRASIFTGNFPHDTGVFTNVGSDGGFSVFHARGEESRSFNVALQKSGYQTAMMGKYLNGYLDGRARTGVANSYVPPGWNEWDVAGFGYPEYDYPLNENGVVHHFGHRPRAYLTDVLARRGTAFVDRATASGQPFFLELATFAPHAPYTPARRDAHGFPGLTAPQPPNFDALPASAPRWLVNHPPLSARKIKRINRAFRRRVQSVQAVDDMIGRIEAELAATGQSRNTYFVFSSDNGYHMGEYRLLPGKLTAFNTDIQVPLVVAGPGVPAHSRTPAVTQNIDLAATFAAMGGTTLSGDGHSLLPLLTGQTAQGWRNAALVEHHGPDSSPNDPDRQTGLSGNPTTYEALRTPDYLYVEYRDGEREFYDLGTDPFELHNTIASLTLPQLGQLHTELAQLEGCHTATECWVASHVPPLGGP
ncbi:MAG: sulfatase family protein [Solirubrobacteraceae bacterium]